jgi:HAD superfamily hydrolase (TIGR01484 family)
MRPLTELPQAVLSAVRGVFCDIDDTLTSDGKLTAEAYSSLQALHESGKWVIPITGRPAGWCDHIARMWPVDAVVGENGAFYFVYEGPLAGQPGKLSKRFIANDAERSSNRRNLNAVGERILREVAGSALASDQLYREADLAIDFCEDVPRLSDSAIDRIVSIMQESGMTAKVSSIHVNGWYGNYDKLGMTKTLMRERFGVDLDREREKFMFIGDSPNDAPLFAYFPHSIGVANVADFAARLEHSPKYVTTQRSGSGFAEMVNTLLSAPEAIPATGTA